jgi:2-polyprenyl-3-methyl-5-hydroxy-6-metoxy-1,4-benzoquinol methylase
LEEYIVIESCPLCSSIDCRISFRKGKFTGKECTSCGLIYITPRLKEINSIYTDDKTSSPSEYYRYAQQTDLKVFKRRVKSLEKYTEKDSIIDIGCSTGNFLEAARSEGWQKFHGIEPNEKAAIECRKKGFEVTNAFLDESILGADNRRFSAAYLGDVIEHVPDPVRFINLASDFLEPGGVLLIVTPNIGSVIAKLLQIKPLEHILYFNKKSLEYLLRKCNLDIQLISTTTREHSLKALVYSTTFSSKPVLIRILKLMNFFKAEALVNLFGKLFFKDELIAVAKKKI